MYCQKCGNKLSEEAKFCTACGNATSLATVKREPGSMGMRFLNSIIDRLCIMVLAFIVGFVSAILLPHAMHPVLSFVLGLLCSFGFYLFFETIWQRTPGKWATGLKVVREDGARPTFVQILGRTFARVIPFEALSFLVGSNPIGWHDRLSRTLVVPAEFSVEDVKSIDVTTIKKKKGGVAVFVIAIVLFVLMVIGLVAFAGLYALGRASMESKDAQIQGSLSSARAQAELYYSYNDDSYAGVCIEEGGISDLLSQAEIKSTSVSGYVCNDSDEAWAATARLSSGEYSCVDSTGVFTTVGRHLYDEYSGDDETETSCDTVPPSDW